MFLKHYIITRHPCFNVYLHGNANHNNRNTLCLGKQPIYTATSFLATVAVAPGCSQNIYMHIDTCWNVYFFECLLTETCCMHLKCNSWSNPIQIKPFSCKHSSIRKYMSSCFGSWWQVQFWISCARFVSEWKKYPGVWRRTWF